MSRRASSGVSGVPARIHSPLSDLCQRSILPFECEWCGEVLTPVISGPLPEMIRGFASGCFSFAAAEAILAKSRLSNTGCIQSIRPLAASFFTRSRRREVPHFFREFTATVPDRLSAYAGILTGLDGSLLTGIISAYSGPREAAEAVVKPLREFGPPVVDPLVPIPFTALQSMLKFPVRNGAPSSLAASFVKQLTTRSAQTNSAMCSFVGAVPRRQVQRRYHSHFAGPAGGGSLHSLGP